VRSCFPSGTLFYGVTGANKYAIRINAAIFVEIFFKVIKYLIQKYIILWLVKPNKTYNEFTAKKYRTINKLFLPKA
jgi:phage shock protein PspC (stress-responsive transcriptional regulator)